MRGMIAAALAAFVMALALGRFAIPWLRQMKFGQNIYELAPESHKKKQGIPTMGGVIFAAPLVLVSIVYGLFRGFDGMMALTLLSALGFGLIGFADDFIKIRKKRNLGLTPIQKLAPQFALSLIMALWALCDPRIGSRWILPFGGGEWDLGLWFVPLTVFVLVGTVNSANLLDGLDGLLSKVSAVDFLTLSVMLLLLKEREGAPDTASLAAVGLILFGALMGFLRYNGYPAQTFMGDVGSFTIGGAMAGLALCGRMSLFLPILAFALMVSSLSDIIQIGYFKLTHGKRVFRMAPLHHHFELGGMPEPRIITMYVTFTAMLCLVALAGFVV